jgi:glycosyltransferase involved in cell wall biosynthesis
VVAVSQDLARRVVELGVVPERVRVIYSGVNVGLFHPGSAAQARSRLGLEQGEPVVLFVGNLVPVKGIDVLIDGLARLASECVSFRAYLIGEGPLRGALARRITEQGLESRVRLCGSLSHEQLPDWYRAASVVVLPSRSEGVPNVLLESVACGTPFVASRVGGIPELAHLGNNALVPPGDPAALAGAIRDRLDRANPVATRTAAAPRSHADAVGELEDLFERTIREHRAARSAGAR